MNKQEVLYYLKREINTMMVTRHESVVTLWCPLNTKQSETDLNNPYLPMLEYARHILCLLFFVPVPERILVIGLGGGTIPTALCAAAEGAVIDVVEIDTEVAAIAERFFHFRPSNRLRLFLGDGAVFVQESKALYDVIILDAYTGAHISDSVCSEAFYSGVSHRLTDRGIVAVNIITGNKALFRNKLRLLHGVFGSISTLDCKGSKNTIVFAGKKKIHKSTLLQNAELVEPRFPAGFRPSALIEQFKGVPLFEKAKWQLSNMCKHGR
ncbi:spermidine synthase [Candidatus Magnetominusculus xianensis]|uniref:Spermidine synthase n=1 Tax=Candidatus Magnetominusculus xianensis TaxID=1748249 RepID=A0ABR5SFS0_9BACT|nr:fused MFS/spermidine synthase [Candidatus Magnetominusculus xianensis]KWT86791.1 spermidine synthase [Candidatus Magnetominusculus xianensis]